MKFQKHGEWSETPLRKRPQCVYINDAGHTFIVRQYGEYEWVAINISLPKFFCGQIIAKGGSDMDCFDKAVEEVNK